MFAYLSRSGYENEFPDIFNGTFSHFLFCMNPVSRKRICGEIRGIEISHNQSYWSPLVNPGHHGPRLSVDKFDLVFVLSCHYRNTSPRKASGDVSDLLLKWKVHPTLITRQCGSGSKVFHLFLLLSSFDDSDFKEQLGSGGCFLVRSHEDEGTAVRYIFQTSRKMFSVRDESSTSY